MPDVCAIEGLGNTFVGCKWRIRDGEPNETSDVVELALGGSGVLVQVLCSFVVFTLFIDFVAASGFAILFFGVAIAVALLLLLFPN